LKTAAESHLGYAVDAAVITVPAYFDERARMATKQAGDIAGFRVLRLLAEPTAAALAYGLDQRDQGTFLVYDLGGGTFDVSLLRLTQGVFRVVGSGGHVDLGGDDLDDVLAKSFLYHTSYDAPLTPEDAARLKQEAKATRERLSHQDFADMTLWLPNRDLSHRFSRGDFEALAAPLIDQTLRLTEEVLTEAGVAVSALDGVLLVGGTTRTPMIEVALTQCFGALPLKGIDPDHSVAVGAAYQAHALTYGSDTLLVDVTPLSLGLETMGGIVEKIIPRNTLLPASKTQTFTTYQDGQTAMMIHVMQGERELVADCRSLATFTLTGIPPMLAGAAKIAVTFQMDVDGLLTVSAEELTTKIRQEILVKPSYGLSQEAMKQAIYESLEYAQQDMEARLLASARVSGQRVLQAAKKLLLEHHTAPTPERQAVENAMQILKECLEHSDRTAIDEAREAMEASAAPWVARRMNQALGQALTGQSVDTFSS
jgi:molecular chaperone HscA